MESAISAMNSNDFYGLLKHLGTTNLQILGGLQPPLDGPRIFGLQLPSHRLLIFSEDLRPSFGGLQPYFGGLQHPVGGLQPPFFGGLQHPSGGLQPPFDLAPNQYLFDLVYDTHLKLLPAYFPTLPPALTTFCFLSSVSQHVT